MKKLITILICFLLLSFSVYGCSKESLVMIPDLRGMKVTEVRDMVESLGLTLITEKGSYSTSVEADYILAQVPFPFTEVKKGRSVSVKLSKGPPIVSCPDLVGVMYGEASQILKKLNLHVSSLIEVNDLKNLEEKLAEGLIEDGDLKKKFDFDLRLGVILSQKPLPGTEMKANKEVEITVYVPDLPTTPNLIDKHLNDVKFILESSGYVLGTITYVPNSGHARGVVYQQEPLPYAPAEMGTLINVIVNENLEED